MMESDPKIKDVYVHEEGVTEDKDNDDIFTDEVITALRDGGY